VNISGGFSSFSSNDLEATRDFYERQLGVKTEMGDAGLGLTFPNGTRVFIYPKPDHQPATFTVLNLFVPDLEQAVDELTTRGIRMERYEGFDQDERGIARGMGGGPDIAWFTDPAGNIVSVMPDDVLVTREEG
jgi:catechol 2,3-dioxygenase-like lactoylglutathione lyase family enzyme